MKKGINYVMYILIILVIIVGAYFFFGGSSSTDGGEEKPKEELVIENNVIDLKVGEEAKVGASVTNNTNATIKYVSTNPSIATVDAGGNIKAISNGTTYIIVNYVSSNNDNYNKQCIVNVSGGIEITSISLPNGELLMKPSDTYKLDVTTEPLDVDKSKLSYIVNNSNIITASEDGTITAVSEGIAALRVTAKENINADIRVRVVNNPEIVSGIYIMPEKITSVRSITLKVDEERKINYTVEPADSYMQNVIWESSNPNVATVTDGSVKALSEGDATITMRTVNGITLTVYVTVKPSTVEVESIKLISESAIELKVGDSSQISYEVLPNEATDKSVTFQSTNTSVANVDSNGLITAVGEGSAVVRVTSSNGAKTADVMVNVKKKSSSGGGGSSCSGTTHVGNVNSSLLGSPTDDGFDKCKRVSQNLVPFIGGTNYGQDGYYVMHVGETLTVNVKLPTICGRIDRLTRTNHDGQSGWSNYVSQTSSPKVNRNDPNTYVSGVDGYTWKITANKKGCVIVSQTAQFDVTSPSGRTGNMKSMIRLHIKIED
jgi:uncharacterized protein YjdB